MMIQHQNSIEKPLKDLKYLVKEINVYYNEIYKDYGTSIDKISLLKYIL